MAHSDYTDDGSEFDSPSIQEVVRNALLMPFRVMFSKNALYIYLNILLFTSATFVLLAISGVAYAIFYLNFIPTVEVDRDVHLQFGSFNTWGIASLHSEFVTSQLYDVAVTLDLPRTPSNLDIGNFMIDLALYSDSSEAVQIRGNNTSIPIAQSRRPALLTYNSPLVDMAKILTRLPLYVVGWSREAETLEVPMMEKVEFPRGAHNLPKSLRLQIIYNGNMQIYSARVEFRARFTGLRWIMYRWKLTSFAVFTSIFWTVSMISASLTWFVLKGSRPKHGPNQIEEVKEESRDLVKEEHETEDSLSYADMVKIKKESGGGESDTLSFNVPFGLTKDDMREIFAQRGTVPTIHILTDRTGRSKGLGYVQYSSVEEAKAALSQLKDDFDYSSLNLDFSASGSLPYTVKIKKEEPSSSSLLSNYDDDEGLDSS